MKLLHRVDEAAEQLAEWFGLSEREVNWARSAKAGNDDDGYSEALLSVDEEGWSPLGVRASEYEVSVLDCGGRDVPVDTGSQHATPRVGTSPVETDGGSE